MSLRSGRQSRLQADPGSGPQSSPWSGLAVAALLAVPLIGLQAMDAASRAALRYERDAVLHGEWWRLLTAHGVHLGGVHLWMNVTALLLCATLAPDAFRWRALPGLMGRLLWLGWAVGVGLLLAAPQVPDYVGLSGVLYGLYLWTLWPSARRGDPTALLTLIGLLGWGGWQALSGPLPMENDAIGGHVVTQAHLYGLVGGVMGLVAQARWQRRSWPAPTPASSPSVNA